MVLFSTTLNFCGNKTTDERAVVDTKSTVENTATSITTTALYSGQTVAKRISIFYDEEANNVLVVKNNAKRVYGCGK